jgi:hypothetical protein
MYYAQHILSYPFKCQINLWLKEKAFSHAIIFFAPGSKPQALEKDAIDFYF